MSKVEFSDKTDKPVIIETFILRLDIDVECIFPDCLLGSVIMAGEDALQSPSTPGYYYHIDCFKIMIRERGKDPDKFLKIINISSGQGKN
jgi:hypothetical protein